MIVHAASAWAHVVTTFSTLNLLMPAIFITTGLVQWKSSTGMKYSIFKDKAMGMMQATAFGLGP
jgi:hypothetical protein